MVLKDGQRAEIQEKLKWLMALRVVVVTLLLGTLIVLQVSDQKALHSASVFSFLIASTYLLTILYSLAINRIKALLAFTYFQLLMDLVFETVLVAVTGGIESPFSFLYIFTILSASAIVGRRSGILTGALAGIFFGAVVDSQYLGLISGIPQSTYQGSETLYVLFLNIVAFVVVAYLAGSLTEKLRKTRESLVEKTAGLADLRAFHENVVQSISSGVLTTDGEGRITSLNRAGSEIIGYSTDEILGRSWSEILNADDLRDLVLGAHLLNGSVRLDRKIKKKDGSELLLGMTVSPLRSSHSVVTGGVWAFQDLTRIRELEEEMKRKNWLATIGEMAAGMAHEIRNPLASISGAMQVIKTDQDLGKDTKYLMEIGVKETDRLNSIVTSFLRYARPAALVMKRCDLHGLITETVDLFQKSKEWQERVEIRLGFSTEPFELNLDADQMKQVFLNLIINSFQAMPEGGLLEIGTRRVEPKRKTDRMIQSHHSWVQITFKDNGIGISNDQREKIFYPFFTTKEKGSGLGLSIVHRIIEDHGGRINMVSERGQGTTFNLLLPIEEEKLKVSGQRIGGEASAQYLGR